MTLNSHNAWIQQQQYSSFTHTTFRRFKLRRSWLYFRRQCLASNIAKMISKATKGKRQWHLSIYYKGKRYQVWALAIAPLTWVRLVTSSALQSRKWQLIGMSQWCRNALCGHPLPALTDNWTHGAASRHTITPISHTRPSSRSRSYYSFPVPLRVGGWVGLSTQ